MDEQEKKEIIIDALISEIESYRRPDRTLEQFRLFLGTLDRTTIKDTVIAVVRAEKRRKDKVIAKLQNESQAVADIEEEIKNFNMEG